MATSSTEVDSTVRDEFFKKVRTNTENNKCIDCEKKNPKWASVHLGLLLCIDCAGKHRAWGPSFSLVRSITLDSWSVKQLAFIEQGGNDRFLDYLRKNGLILANSREIDYKNNIITRYKQELGKLVDELLQKEEKKAQAEQQQQQAPQQQQQQQQQQTPQQQQQQQSPEKPSPAQLAAQREAEAAAKKQEEFNNNILNAKKAQSHQVVFNQNAKTTATGKNKPIAQKIDDNLNFDDLIFDDGVEEAKKAQVAQPAIQQTEFKLYEEEFPQQEQEKRVTLQQPTAQQNQQFEKLKSQNVKAISSDAIFNSQETTAQDRQNYVKFNGATAISSKAFFGQPEEEEPNDTGSAIQETLTNFFWNVREKATDYFERVKENLKK